MKFFRKPPRAPLPAEVTYQMVDAALVAMFGATWEDRYSGVIGLKQPRSLWREDMRRALSAAITDAGRAALEQGS